MTQREVTPRKVMTLPTFPLQGYREKAPQPNWPNPEEIKPRIVWMPGLKLKNPDYRYDLTKGLWLCHNDYWIMSQATSPEDAYNKWLEKTKTFHLLKRAGWWNKKDTLRWYKEGCWPQRSLIGHRRMYGYLPGTDELVLQG